MNYQRKTGNQSKMNNWKLKNIGISLDGGTTTLICLNELGIEIVIEMVQNVSTQYTEEISKIPGRIYIDNELVEKRSEIESELLNNLETKIVPNLEGINKERILRKIRFIRSQKYLDLKPEKLELSEKRKEY